MGVLWLSCDAGPPPGRPHTLRPVPLPAEETSPGLIARRRTSGHDEAPAE